jgi:hypothetical protein
MSAATDWIPFDYVFERFRRRLAGLTDAEYLWSPVPGCWSIDARPDGRHEAHEESPEPDPPPLTTIAWRMAHIGDVLRGERNWRWLRREPELRDADIDHPVTAAGGIAYVTASYDAWSGLVASLTEDELRDPLGPVAGPYADDPIVAFVLHILDELIHHTAEVGLMRDLYAALS